MVVVFRTVSICSDCLDFVPVRRYPRETVSCAIRRGQRRRQSCQTVLRGHLEQANAQLKPPTHYARWDKTSWKPTGEQPSSGELILNRVRVTKSSNSRQASISEH